MNTLFNNKIILKVKDSKAIVLIDKGASLVELILKDKLIIKDFTEKEPYANSYASAILFPFVNRVYNGEYTYKNTVHQLEKNNCSNALHGLLYNKEFKIIKEKKTATYHTLKLEYKNIKREKGFPFLYAIVLEYTLHEELITLNITVHNKDEVSFPFTIGWHPYFFTEDRKNSVLKFVSSEKIIHNKEMIPIGSELTNRVHIIRIQNNRLDDCYKLKDDVISFKTPQYTVDIKSSFKDNYLQIYTPDLNNYVAIEPVTGVSNSFNNKIGLQELDSHKPFNIEWLIQLKND